MYFIPTENPFVTKIVGFALVDPMGNIPKWCVNSCFHLPKILDRLINKGKGIAPTVIRLLGKMLKEQFGDPEARWCVSSKFLWLTLTRDDLKTASPVPTMSLPATVSRAQPGQPQQQPQQPLLDKEAFLVSLVEVQSRLLKLVDQTRTEEKRLEIEKKQRSGISLLVSLLCIRNYLPSSSAPSKNPIISVIAFVWPLLVLFLYHIKKTDQKWLQKFAFVPNFLSLLYNKITGL